MRRVLALMLPLVVAAAACGTDGPTSPSPAAGSGALIKGAIVSEGSSGTNGFGTAGSSTWAIPAGLTVTVVGTTISAPVDAGGTFSLRDVPAGDVQLRFSSPTFTGSVGLAAVQSSQTIEIGLAMTETTVTVETEARILGAEIELEGRIEEFPVTPEDDMVVAGRTVLTNVDTSFVIGGAQAEFTDLQIGFRVHVKGSASGLDVLALLVTVQNTNPDIQFPINGIVEDFSGTEDEFQFEVGRHLVKGDADTEFFGNSSFEDLENGVRVEVKSLLRDGYFYAMRLHVETEEVEDEEEGDQEESASVEGLLTGLAGIPPTFMVGTTLILTTSATEVQRKGDVQTLEELVENMIVHVVGDRQADGSIIARKVQIKGDAVGGLFQIEGSLGGLKGTCPAVSFSVNGYDIVADAATIYDPVAPGCAGLKSGDKVLVDGVVLAGGTVLATSIKK
jgi:hypothetical protein